MTKPRGEGLSAPSLKTPKSFPDWPIAPVPVIGCSSSYEGSYWSLANQSSTRAKQGEVREAGAALLREEMFCLLSGSGPQGLFTQL